MTNIAGHQRAKVKRTIGAGEIIDPHAIDEHQRLRTVAAAQKRARLTAKAAACGNGNAGQVLQGIADGGALQLVEPFAVDDANRLSGFGSRLFKSARGDNDNVVPFICHCRRRQQRKRRSRIF